MTRVLVLGASGMLGHKLVQGLGARYETWGTVRGDRPAPALARLLPADRTVTGVRADDPASIARAVETTGATAVVNAIGIVKQDAAANRAVPSITVNALLPHQIAEIGRERGARLIHVSTDCVFTGARGGYTEDDVPDARDLYGRSKLLGEVTGPGALTLRTSIVGRELLASHGLFEWFLSEEGRTVRGFSRAVFSGLTTNALTTLIGDVLRDHPQLDGLWHVSADAIDKRTLLEQLRDAVGANITIDEDESLVIDRSLDSTRFRDATGWRPPSWQAMLAELAADPTPYTELRGL
jgi:dTDP-4-dehydrorhamnose reductase